MQRLPAWQAKRLRYVLAFAIAGILLAQEQATVRVEVTAGPAPVAGAAVTFNGKALQTDTHGVATAAVGLGAVEVRVVKEGFLPAAVTLQVTEAREWGVAVEL